MISAFTTQRLFIYAMCPYTFSQNSLGSQSKLVKVVTEILVGVGYNVLQKIRKPLHVLNL
jgi:hypothetical protein